MKPNFCSACATTQRSHSACGVPHRPGATTGVVCDRREAIATAIRCPFVHTDILSVRVITSGQGNNTNRLLLASSTVPPRRRYTRYTQPDMPGAKNSTHSIGSVGALRSVRHCLDPRAPVQHDPRSWRPYNWLRIAGYNNNTNKTRLD